MAIIDYLTPCTLAEDEACQIFHRLSTWNELLSQLCMELRHYPKNSMLLSLVDTSKSFLVTSDEEHLHQGTCLVHYLLKNHRCVAVVEVNVQVLGEYAGIVLESLRGNSSIKKVKITWGTRMRENCLGILPSLGAMNELKISQCHWDYSPQLLYSLTELMRTTASLTFLNISLAILECDVMVLLPALVENNTIKEVSLCGSLFNNAFNIDPEMLRDYLLRNTTLTSLILVQGHVLLNVVFRLLLDCLLENRTLTCVTVRGAFINEENAQAVATVIEHNNVLRCFNLQNMSMFASNRVALLALFHRWHQALMTTETLAEFRLPIDACTEEQWRQFFSSLANKTNWKKVTIEFGEESYNLVRGVHKMLAECGVEQKIRFKSSIFSDIRPDHESWHCYVVSHDQTTDTFLDIVQHLPTLSYVTSAQLLIWNTLINLRANSAIAFFLRSARVLKKLHIHILGFGANVSNAGDIWSDMIEALSQNTSLEELSVRSDDIDDGTLEKLAVVFKTSQTMHDVHLETEPLAEYGAFVRALCVGVEENYTMLRVGLVGGVEGDLEKQWFLVRDTARRNSGLVTLSAEFVSGLRCDRYGAEALERVSRHKTLPERVSQLASVSEDDAVVLIRRALRSFEGLHAFMRLAGVVAERVECHRREDGAPQLDTLGEECWRVIRQFLLLEDIRDSIVLLQHD